jgi:hypothetical protein
MTEQAKVAVTKSCIAIGAIAAVWFFFSFILTLILAGAEDNPDMNAPVPSQLKMVCAIVFFPMRYLSQWDRPPASFSDVSFGVLGLLEMAVNGLFWGFLFVFLCRLVTRLFAAKKLKKTPA